MASPRPLAAALLLATLALAGCSSSDSGDGAGGPGGAGTGSASAYVKDAPSDDFREVHVLVGEVAVHRSAAEAETSTTAVGTATGVSTGVGNTTVTASATASATATATATPTNGTGQQAGWIVLFADAAGLDVDLLGTTGARAAFLGEAELAAGRYQQVRITVLEAYGITHEGEREEIDVSSGTLRSVRSFDVEEGRETRITVDIDLDRSLRQSGNGQWRMTPVIGRTTAAVVDDASSGEDASQPGDVETVPEAGGDAPGVSATATASPTATATATGTGSASGTSTGPA